MKYRVVEMSDGRFQAQYRSMWLWWVNSVHAPNRDKEDQIEFAKACGKPPVRKIRTVWP